MATYQVHLRHIVEWDAKPLPPLPLDPGRPRRCYNQGFNNDLEKSPVAVHRTGNVFPPEFDIGKFHEADSRRTRSDHRWSPSRASAAPAKYMPKGEDNDSVPETFRHSRQKSDQHTTRAAHTGAPPAITTVEDLSLSPKIRRIIGIDSPRKAKTARWDPISTQAAPSPTTVCRPASTTSAYSQASGPRREMDMLFHIEEIVEEPGMAEDGDEINRRLESLIQSPGFAAIGYFPGGSASDPQLSPLAVASREDERWQQGQRCYPEQPLQDQRSSREMYHELVVELAQSAPAAPLPPPPKPPIEVNGHPSDSSSLYHRRHHSSLSAETNRMHHGNPHASCPHLRKPTVNSISVFDHESSDSESDSDSRPLWSPRLAFLGRRPVSKPNKRR